MKNANPVSWRLGLLLTALVGWAACRKPMGEALAGGASVPAGAAKEAVSRAEKSPAPAAVAKYGYEVRRTWPHDRGAFTQGLVFRHGNWIESTGLNGRSSLREVELESGRILKQVPVPAQYFAEGVAVMGSLAFQLTWQGGRGFVYDVDTFRLLREFTYEGEGWGLATNGQELILSDGTSRIRFIDPTSSAVTRTIAVTANGQPVAHLNELEYIKGEIFANVWQTDRVVRIDPATGQVRGEISFAGLLPPQDRRRDTDVLNGIAYDAAGDRLFVTGKYWPKIFEVRLKPIP